MKDGGCGQKYLGGRSVIIIGQRYDGLWYKVESPRFPGNREAFRWLNEQIRYEELSSDDEFFFACCLSVQDLKTQLGVDDE